MHCLCTPPLSLHTLCSSNSKERDVATERRYRSEGAKLPLRREPFAEDSAPSAPKNLLDAISQPKQALFLPVPLLPWSFFFGRRPRKAPKMPEYPGFASVPAALEKKGKTLQPQPPTSPPRKTLQSQKTCVNGRSGRKKIAPKTQGNFREHTHTHMHTKQTNQGHQQKEIKEAKDGVGSLSTTFPQNLSGSLMRLSEKSLCP